MDNVTKEIILSRLTEIGDELAQIEELITATMSKDEESIEEIIRSTGYPIPGDSGPSGKLGPEGIPHRIPDKGPKGEPIPDNRGLDIKYPCPNEDGYRLMLDEINNTDWYSGSLKHYRRYQYLKGAIINHLRAYNKTSVPLKGAEPEWNLIKE